MGTNYPQRHQELQGLFGKLGKELSGPISGFARLHRDAVAQGARLAHVDRVATRVEVQIYPRLLGQP